jgi:aminoglycoside phosphotransferase (APT) family kinase protein
MWSSLSRPDIDAEDPACSDARRRILGRLGAYAELIVRPLNLRPTAATLIYEDDQRIEVRVSTPRSHVVLAIAPDGDLAAEIAWLRALAHANLPLPRLIASDLSCTVVPFTYAIESYVGGWPLDRLPADARMRVAARQVGRTLRRAHQVPAAGFGRPTTTGRWPTRSWHDALYGWLGRRETLASAEEVLGVEATLLLLAATIDHPALACERPSTIHGAVEPARAIATVGETVQLEALTRPGDLVGGDPMFDLAYGLLPRHPAAFRQGLLESYTVAGPLAPAQEERLRRLGLLLLVADTLWRAEPAALAWLPDEVEMALAKVESVEPRSNDST